MELRHLRYVVAVAECLNFREASRKLHVSQPSLSVQIKQLEDEVGVRLFHRSKRHVEITRGGEAFLITAREVLSMLERSSSAARQAQQGEVGTIRIGFVPNASVAIVPRLLEEIKKQLPLVDVELKEWPEATQIRELQSGALDIGITHREKVPDSLESMLLLRERLLLALPKHHQAARKKAVNFDDVRDDLLLIPRKDLFPTLHQMIIRIFVAGGVALNRTQAIEHLQTAIALVVQMQASRSFPSQLTYFGLRKSFSGRSMLSSQRLRLLLFGCEVVRTLSSGAFWKFLGKFTQSLTRWLEENHD